MLNEEFVQMLKEATESDKQAIWEIIQMYERLIIKNSFVNGKYDEDCRAYIESILTTAIKNFKII